MDYGHQHSLPIPSGQQSALKLVRGFTVLANGSADLTIGFDLRKSVHDAESRTSDGAYLLRLVGNAEVDHLAAEVTDIQNCTNGEADLVEPEDYSASSRGLEGPPAAGCADGAKAASGLASGFRGHRSVGARAFPGLIGRGWTISLKIYKVLSGFGGVTN